MPPRRSARVATLAERASSALSPLPLPLVLHVFGLLPADARARAACVCRGWRTTLHELSLWMRLDLSPSNGVGVLVTDAVLAGAAGKARGQLASLDVRGCGGVTFDALLAVAQANSGALRELCAGASARQLQHTLDADRVEQLLAAAPQLTACHADVFGWSSVPNARRMLRNEASFQSLRVSALRVNFDDDADEATVLALAADMAAHASLKHVTLYNAPLHTLAALDAVVDAVLARGLVYLRLWDSRLSPAAAPALVRLLGSGTLTELNILQTEQLLDGPSAALLGDALRANTTLTSLSLYMKFWHDAGAAAALLGALTGHSSLHTLNLAHNSVREAQPAAFAALGALAAANAPALTKLDVSYSRLGNAGLRPLFEALRTNTHLHELNVAGNNMSAAFSRNVLLPAVRANTSLRKLVIHLPSGTADNAFTREAEALVEARGAAVAAAE
jgi:hypothetical protein